ncbi:hypothetical protein PAXRUDRAFT_159071, partial [Paxillus rubicundulus Ve08.2h10]
SGVLTEWKKTETAQKKKRNTARREAYREAMRLWKEESDLAKQNQRWVGWAKPKLGKLEPQVPKPGSKREEGTSGEAREGNADITGSEDEHENADVMESDGESVEE